MPEQPVPDTSPSDPSASSALSDSGAARSKREIWLLLAILAIAFILRASCFSGFVEGDDSAYLSGAVQAADGRFEEGSHHWSRRIGVYYPVAALFKMAGASLTVAAAVPMFWSLYSIVIIYLAGRTVYGDGRVGLLGAALMAVFPLDVIMSTQLFPGMGIGALCATAFLAFYTAEKHNGRWLYLIAGLALGLAYMHRATAVFLFLPLGIYILYCRRWRWEYLLIGVGLAGALAIEAVAFWATLGDPLNRFNWITKITSKSNFHFSEPRKGGPLLAPLVAFSTEQEYGLFYFFIAWATIALLLRRDKSSWPLILFFVTVAFYTLWGTVSIKTYRNAAPWPRYQTLYTMPALLILARWFLLCTGTMWRRILLAVLVSSSLVCVYLDSSRTHLTLGDNLIAYHGKIDGKKFAVEERAYLFLYFQNGFKHPENVEVFAINVALEQDPDKKAEKKAVAGERALAMTPDVRVRTELADLSDCLVAIDAGRVWNDGFEPPAHWKKVGRVMREHRWFAEPLRNMGGIGNFLSEKLSPVQAFLIYEIPPLDNDGETRDEESP